MKIVLIGSGGREHAILSMLHRAHPEFEYLAIPGNPGMVDAKILAGDVLSIAKEEAVDLAIIGPEVPLAEGLADDLRGIGIQVLGPGQLGAKLESSKDFAKDFMNRHQVPTANSVTVTSYEAMMDQCKLPIVVKADGLAAGKGVFLPETEEEFEDVARLLFLEKKLGKSGECVLLEERLIGPEVSFFYLVNEKGYCLLGEAKDHKRANDGDRGPNTGGMGTLSPVMDLSDQERREIDIIMQRTHQGLLLDQIDFRGVLFIGCMRTKEGLKVLEYNVRFGDPETQALLPRVEEDLLELLRKTAAGEALPKAAKLSEDVAVCVILASANYPEKPDTGHPIRISSMPHDILVFHSGTKLEEGELVNASGRVFSVVARGADVEEARQRVYKNIPRIQFRGMWYRKDIGQA